MFQRDHLLVNLVVGNSYAGREELSSVGSEKSGVSLQQTDGARVHHEAVGHLRIAQTYTHQATARIEGVLGLRNHCQKFASYVHVEIRVINVLYHYTYHLQTVKYKIRFMFSHEKVSSSHIEITRPTSR